MGGVELPSALWRRRVDGIVWCGGEEGNRVVGFSKIVFGLTPFH